MKIQKCQELVAIALPRLFIMAVLKGFNFCHSKDDADSKSNDTADNVGHGAMTLPADVVQNYIPAKDYKENDSVDYWPEILRHMLEYSLLRLLYRTALGHAPS